MKNIDIIKTLNLTNSKFYRICKNINNNINDNSNNNIIIDNNDNNILNEI